MLRRVVVTAAALLAGLAFASPARALTQGEQNPNDIYVLTQDKKIVRIASGSSTPDAPVDLSSYLSPSNLAAFVDFDPGSCQFVVGPFINPDVSQGNYLRLSQTLGSPQVISGTNGYGGQEGAVDRFRPTVFGRSDILIANPYTPTVANVLRIRGDGTINPNAPAADVYGSVVDTTHPSWRYTVPENVAVNWSNGDIFVSVQATVNLPAAVLQYDTNGHYIQRFIVPNGAQNPVGLTYDNEGAVPYHHLIAAAFDGTKEIFMFDVYNQRPSGLQTKTLGPPPTSTAQPGGLTVSPQGKLLYPDVVNGKVWSIDLTTGAPTLVANVAKALSVAFVSRACFPQLDTQAPSGTFATTTGPNGRPAVKVTVTDPDFSAGIDHIDLTGSNLAVNGTPLPCTIQFDCRQEITKYVFVAEKINASLGASIHVVATDCAGHVGDPPINMLVLDKGKPQTTTMDLTGLDKSSTRTLVIDNQGVDSLTLQLAGWQFSVSGDANMASGQTVTANLSDTKKKQSSVTIALNGRTTVILPSGPTLAITTHGHGKNAGNPANIMVY